MHFTLLCFQVRLKNPRNCKEVTKFEDKRPNNKILFKLALNINMKENSLGL